MEDLTAVVDTNTMCPSNKKKNISTGTCPMNRQYKEKIGLLHVLPKQNPLLGAMKCHLSQIISKNIDKYKVMALNFMGYHDYDSPLYDVKSLSPSQDN